VESIWAIGPLDGRYRDRTSELREFLSEGALISYRIKVEAYWLLFLAGLSEVAQDLELTPKVKAALHGMINGISPDDCLKVKDIERTTNHDVKAIEYFLRDALKLAGATDRVLAYIHFGCTSEDINNLAYGLMLRDVRKSGILPEMDRLVHTLEELAREQAQRPMLSRTHGQTASPTTLGKEVAVFAYRLGRQRKKLQDIKIDGKISGAVGNYNAHLVAYPTVDWIAVGQKFVEGTLGLAWNPLTTQIENHDSVAEFSDVLRRFNTISIDLCRDFWSYISIGYFRQHLKEGEVGSSTMPHKVNPIDFENAEGNFGLSSALASHFSDKLPISRWQRDLSDSTVLRALGTMIGHSVLAIKSLRKGLGKLAVNDSSIAKDLEGAWEVLGEAVQTVMRRYGVMDAYERLKSATRGRPVTREILLEVIDSCSELPHEVKAKLRVMTPASYVGLAPRLALEFLGRFTDH
jgi:adenylosuccinate lyase